MAKERITTKKKPRTRFGARQTRLDRWFGVATHGKSVVSILLGAPAGYLVCCLTAPGDTSYTVSDAVTTKLSVTAVTATIRHKT